MGFENLPTFNLYDLCKSLRKWLMSTKLNSNKDWVHLLKGIVFYQDGLFGNKRKVMLANILYFNSNVICK